MSLYVSYKLNNVLIRIWPTSFILLLFHAAQRWIRIIRTLYFMILKLGRVDFFVYCDTYRRYTSKYSIWTIGQNCENKVTKILKFPSNREIKVLCEIWPLQIREINVLRKFHVIRYVLNPNGKEHFSNTKFLSGLKIGSCTKIIDWC